MAALFAEPGAAVPVASDRTLKALRCSNEEIAVARVVMEALGAVPSILAMSERFHAGAALRRFVATIGRLQVPLVARVLWARAAAELEAAGADVARVRAARRAGVHLYRRAMRSAWHDPITVGDLAVDGDDLRGIGIHAGPAIGATLKRLLEVVLDDPRRNTREGLLAAATDDVGERG
jgi:tRNA nucleotidyltransferase (CCA-adding enzyme)